MKVTIIKKFEHGGIIYNVGDQFDGNPSELELLARQGYIDKKDAKAADEPHPIDTGTGRGVDVSDSSSGDAGVYRAPVVEPQRTPPPQHKK